MRTDLERLCEKKGVRCEAQYGGVEVPEGWAPGTHPYKVTLRKGNRRLTTAFFCGPAWKKEPTAADVLACLVRDVSAGEQSFEEFCSDMGYDEDSRKAENTHKQCVALAPRVRRFLGDDFEAFEQAEH